MLYFCPTIIGYINGNKHKNSPGDSFSCLQIQKGRELYMDCFARSGEEVCNSTNRYVVGQISGITIIEIVEAAGIPVQE